MRAFWLHTSIEEKKNIYRFDDHIRQCIVWSKIVRKALICLRLGLQWQLFSLRITKIFFGVYLLSSFSYRSKFVFFFASHTVHYSVFLNCFVLFSFFLLFYSHVRWAKSAKIFSFRLSASPPLIDKEKTNMKCTRPYFDVQNPFWVYHTVCCYFDTSSFIVLTLNLWRCRFIPWEYGHKSRILISVWHTRIFFCSLYWNGKEKENDGRILQRIYCVDQGYDSLLMATKKYIFCTHFLLNQMSLVLCWTD